MDGARNTGEIFGEDYVGGIVGNNSSNSEMSNIVNDNKASISGIRYVGGVAGSNSGTISADSMHLDNNGKIYGKQYVGGIVGRNTATGKVENTINDITLYVNSDEVYYKGDLNSTYTYVDEDITGASKMEAQYFGGVVGKNEGTITNAENRGNVNADGASYVGGIVGHNSGALKGAGNSNNGLVQGDSFVGGVGGYNASAIDGSVYETDANNQSILVSESTTVKNQGTVIADNGGAGGIWGYNAGSITNMVMIIILM